MVDAPQVSNAPEPIAQMQQVSNDWGNNLAAGSLRSLDDFINGMIYEFGDKAAALGMAAISKTVELGGRMQDMASKAAAPFKTDFSPSASLQGPESPQHGVGREKQHTVEKSTGHENLGQLASPTTPGLGVGMSQGIGR